MGSSRSPLEIVQEGEDGEITLVPDTVNIIQASQSGLVSIEILSIITDFSEDVSTKAKKIVEHLHNFLGNDEFQSINGGDVVGSSEEDTQFFDTDPVLNILCNYAEQVLQVGSEVNHSNPVKKTVFKNFIRAAAAVKEVAKHHEEDATNDAEPFQELSLPEQQDIKTVDDQVLSTKRIFCWPKVLQTQESGDKYFLILLVDEQSTLGSSKMGVFVNAVSSFQVHLKFSEILDDEIKNVISTNEHLRNMKALLNEGYPPISGEEDPSYQNITPDYACNYPKRIRLETLASFFRQSMLDSNSHCQDKISKALDVEIGECKAETPFKKTIFKINRNNSAIPSRLPKPVPPPDKPKRLLDRAKKEQQEIFDRNWVSLKDGLQNWIDTNLQVQNIDEIDKVFVSKITNIKAPESVKRSLKERLLEIKEVVKQYFVEDTNKESYKAANLETISESEIAQTISHPECSSLIFQAIEKLHRNSAISTNPQLCDSIISTCASNMCKFYAETFLYHPELPNLRSISAIMRLHSELVSDLIVAFDQVLCRLGLHKDKLVRINQLRQTIDNDFYLAFGEFNNKLQTQVKQIQGLINNQRAEYEAGIELLFKSSNKVEASRLAQEHEKLVEACTKNFQKLMTETFDKDEPLNYHISALHFYFDKAYKSYGGEIKPKCISTRHGEATKKPVNAEPNQSVESPNSSERDLRVSKELVDTKGKNVSSEGLMPVTSQPEKSKSDDIILLEFSLNRIGISFLSQDEDFAPENMQYYSDSIALTQKGDWMLYDEQEATRGILIQQSWKLSDCWGSSEKFVLSHAIKISGSDEYVGIEFLIAVWVKLVFCKYFGNPKSINEALIAVPIWFNSVQRQQVVHAMEILGISRNTLVNENSASAYFLYRKLNFPNYNVAVMSEISGKLDIALFHYDQRSKKLCMIAHHGDYEQFLIEKGNFMNFVQYKLFRASNGRQSGNSTRSSINDLHKLWKHTLDHTELTYHGEQINVAKIIIRSESSKKVELLSKFAKEVSADNGSIVIDNTAALAGLAGIYHSGSFRQQKTTEKLVKDFCAYGVLCKTSIDQEEFEMLTKLNANSNRTLTFTIKKKTKTENITLTLCQQQGGLTTDLGSLTVTSPPKSNLKIQVSIQSSVDGRLKLLPVKCYMDNGKISKFLWNEPITQVVFWEVTTSKQEIIEKYTLFVQQLTFFDKRSHEASMISEAAIEKSKAAMQKLQNNQVVLKSQDGQNQVLKLLENATAAIQNNLDIRQVKSHSNLVDQICDRYKL